MSDQGKANYEGYYAAMPGASPVPFDELPHAERLRWDGGAYAVEAWLAEAPVDEDAPGNEPGQIAVGVPGGEQVFSADGWTLTEGTLFVNREGAAVGVFPAGMWLWLRYPNADAKAEL